MKKKSKKNNNIKVYILLICIVAVFMTNSLWSKSVKKFFYPIKYSDIVKKHSENYKIDDALVYAVIKTESGFVYNARSHKDAYGLMQITEDTMNWLNEQNEEKISVEDLYEPEENIKLGVMLLKMNLDYFNGDLQTALAAYNAGRSKVAGWLKDSRFSDDGLTLKNIPYSETEDYVKRVTNNYNEYKNLYS